MLGLDCEESEVQPELKQSSETGKLPENETGQQNVSIKQDSTPQLGSLYSADSSDDDEPIVLSRKKVVSEHATTAASSAEINMSEDSDSDDDDIPIFSKKRTVRRAVLDDSDEDDEKPMTLTVAEESLESTNDADVIKPAKLDNELFDAELGSDSEADQDHGTVNDGSSDSDIGRPDESGSEGDDGPKEVSAALKKRLKQGASKKPSRPSTAKAQKQQREELQDLHAESQRLVRDSAVRLPYHKPNKLDLSNILAKAQQKQQQFQSLKTQSSAPWKDSPDLLKVESKLTVQSVKNTSPPDLVGRIKAKSNKTKDNAAVDTPAKDDTTALLQAVSDSLQTQPKTTNPDLIDDGELPDLEEVTVSDKQDSSSQDNIDSTLGNEKVADVESCDTEPLVEVASLATSEVAKDGDKKEQDSGYLTNPSNHNSSEENSSDNSCGEQQVAAAPDTESATTGDSQGSVSAPIPSHSQLTPKLATLKVDKLLPRLSAGPGDFIDFDDEAATTPKPSGVQLLLDRLVKHSTHSHHKKKNKSVQISTIQKQAGEDNKEEYAVENINYDLEDEEEAADPALEKPGAKLVALKHKLKEQMKLKREEARQRRCEVYEMDNEEGFGEEEEEAELTDLSDTENEVEEEEEEEQEEEEMDQEEYTATEKEEKEDNPFVDAEADDDDDDDAGEMEEDDLHLALDTQDNDGDDELEAEEECESPKQNFLKTAMKKTTQSLDLFDEDANTESPTISQKSNSENIEISDRPFEQLRGQSVKSANCSPRENSCLINEDSSEPPSVNNSTDLNSADVSVVCAEESKLTDRDETTMSSTSLFPKDKDLSVTGGDSSFSMLGTLIPAGQRSSKKHRPPTSDRDTPDIFTPSSKSSLLNTTAKSASKQSELSLPIEDSQDLLRYSPPSSSQAESTPRIGSQSFHFSLPDDTQSQLLDDDGLLRVKSSTKKAARRQLMLESGATQESMDELLGLCSGQFSGATQKGNSSSKSLFGLQSQATAPDGSMDELLGLCSGRFSSNDSSTIPSTQQAGQDKRLAFSPMAPTQDNMCELLDLCSGQFSVKATQGNASEVSEKQRDVDGLDSPVKAVSRKRKRRVIADDDNNSNDSFEIVSGVVPEHDDVDELASDGEEPEAMDPDDEEEVQRRTLFGFNDGKKRGKKIRGEFVDDEAELSGSEYESDEDYDIDEKDDVLEHELGDDDQVYSDSELRDQVGRVHLKTLIDDDKRQLLLYKERYLPDGDLHSDGAGRVRRFRWRNMDEDTQQDMFNQSDEEEKAPETVDEQEMLWRKQRLEREKFLEEQTAAVDTNTSCEVLKLGKTVFKPKPGLSMTPDAVPSQAQPARPTTRSLSASAPRPTNVFKKPHHGSFLTRSKDALAKIAEMNKPLSTTIGGAKNSGKFVFTAMSPEQKNDKKPQVKRSMSVQPSPAAKKPRLDRSSSVTQSSVFNHL